MRPSTSLTALALAFLQATSAMETAFSRKFRLLADMGLNPDGSPMNPPEPVVPAIKASLKAFKSFKMALAIDNTSAPAVETIVRVLCNLLRNNITVTVSEIVRGLFCAWRMRMERCEQIGRAHV